jgi:hypothetical protein
MLLRNPISQGHNVAIASKWIFQGEEELFRQLKEDVSEDWACLTAPNILY